MYSLRDVERRPVQLCTERTASAVQAGNRWSSRVSAGYSDDDSLFYSHSLMLLLRLINRRLRLLVIDYCS